MRILHTAATYCSVARRSRPRLSGTFPSGLRKEATTCMWPRPLSIPRAPYAELRGVHVHRFSVKGNLALGMRGEVEKYCQFVRSGDWDLLVNHCLQTWTTDALLDDLRSYPWPSILVTHGLSGFDNPVFLDYYRRIPEYLTSYATWVSVTNSRRGKAPLRERDKSAPPQVITNGVDLSEWSRPAWICGETWGIGNAAWIVNVSNHNPLKGPSDCSSASRTALRYRGPHHTNRWHVSDGKWGLGDFGVSRRMLL